MNNARTLILCAAAVFASAGMAAAQNAQVDYGLLQGQFYNENSLVGDGDGLFELGVFSGYSDAAGTGYFSGKDYSTLRSSFTPFSTSLTAVQNNGQFYQSVDLLSTPANTRLFAWVFSTTSASSSANWTILSGTIGGSSPYDPLWLAVAPGDPTVNSIELGVISNVMYANSSPGNSLVENQTITLDGADISVVPEPGIVGLLGLGAVAVGWASRRRRGPKAA